MWNLIGRSACQSADVRPWRMGSRHQSLFIVWFNSCWEVWAGRGLALWGRVSNAASVIFLLYILVAYVRTHLEWMFVLKTHHKFWHWNNKHVYPINSFQTTACSCGSALDVLSLLFLSYINHQQINSWPQNSPSGVINKALWQPRLSPELFCASAVCAGPARSGRVCSGRQKRWGVSPFV